MFLLAEVYRTKGDKKYLKKQTRLGLLPGQLTEGTRQGRWADSHNARPAYHYIKVRGLAALIYPQLWNRCGGSLGSQSGF